MQGKGTAMVTHHIQVSGSKPWADAKFPEENLVCSGRYMNALLPPPALRVPHSQSAAQPRERHFSRSFREFENMAHGTCSVSLAGNTWTQALVLGPSTVLGQHGPALSISSHEDLLGSILYYHLYYLYYLYYHQTPGSVVSETLDFPSPNLCPGRSSHLECPSLVSFH